MIPTFKEYLDEGLWSGTISRSKSGEVRQEDKDKIFYQPDVHPIPDFNDWFFQFKRNKAITGVKIYHKPDENYLGIYYGVKRKPNKRYMIVDKNSFGSNVKMDSEEYKIMKSREFVDSVNNELDKLPVSAFKSVNEGLWSGTVSRSKTGEERLEDKSPMCIVCKKMSKYLSEYYKIPDEDLCVISDMKLNGRILEYNIDIHVKDTFLQLECSVPSVYKDDEVKNADCFYDAAVGVNLFGKEGRNNGLIIRNIIKGIRKLYGFE